MAAEDVVSVWFVPTTSSPYYQSGQCFEIHEMVGNVSFEISTGISTLWSLSYMSRDSRSITILDTSTNAS